MQKLNQRGVTLLETILVLSLISIIMISGLNLYQNASESSKTNEAIREITSLSTQVRALYASASDYEDITMEIVESAGAVPKGMKVDSSGNAYNTFNGKVSVEATENSATGASDAWFNIVYNDVPKGACYKIVTSDVGAEEINGEASPLNPADAADACQDSNNNTITFSFGN